MRSFLILKKKGCQLMNMFREAVDQCKLEDMGFTGYSFTWSNGRVGEENIQERLDRFFATEEWLNLYPSSEVTHGQKSFSDHCPILLESQKLRLKNTNSKRHTFKFEATWAKEVKCEELVKKAWVKGGDAIVNFKNIKEVFLSSDLFNLKKPIKELRILRTFCQVYSRSNPHVIT